MFGRKSRRIAELDRQLLRALGIIGEKNDVIVECMSANVRLHDGNERLHNQLRAMRERLPRLDDDRDTFDREVKDGWGETDAGRAWAAASGTSADFDPDVTRAYVREPVDMAPDPWLSEER